MLLGTNLYDIVLWKAGVMNSGGYEWRAPQGEVREKWVARSVRDKLVAVEKWVVAYCRISQYSVQN